MSQVSRQARSDERCLQILEAAERHFAVNGFEATRLEDIGRDIGVSRSVVLYHFTDKRSLYSAVLEELFGGCLAALRRPLAGAGDLPTRIENAVRAAVGYMAERPAAARIAMREAGAERPDRLTDIRRHTRPILDLISILFEEGTRTGVFRPEHPDPLRFVSVISGTTLFYVTALPTLADIGSTDHLSAENVAALQRDLAEITRRLLGIRGPRPLNR
jgi:TetR/AcrR family transcriptional regulator